ncbi:MAG: hypothetical protein AAFY27_10500 [Pseudomonadota bacterium]
MVIVEAGWQSTKLRLIALLFMGAGLVGLYFTPEILMSLTDVDGNLEPLDARIGLGGLIGGASLLATVGMWLYVYVYVVSISRSGDYVVVRTQGVFRPTTRIIPITGFIGSTAHDGRTKFPMRFQVNAPYTTLRIDGWWLPLVVDEQSETFHGDALGRIVQDSEMIRRRAATARK